VLGGHPAAAALEQGHRVDLRQRREREDLLACEPQRHPARHQEAGLGGARPPGVEQPRGLGLDLLEVVEHHQAGPAEGQRVPHPRDHVPRRQHAQRGGHDAHHAVAAAGRGQIAEPGAVGQAGRPGAGVAQGEARLAHPSRPHQRDERARDGLELGELRAPADERAALGRQPRGRGRSRLGAGGLGRGGLPLEPEHRDGQPHAHPGHRLDHRGLIGQRLAQLVDHLPRGLLGHQRVGPQRLDDGPAAVQPIGLAHQHHEQLHRLGLHQDGRPLSAEAVGGHVELEWTESVTLGGHLRAYPGGPSPHVHMAAGRVP
jgi:hypothetical protein